MHDLIKELIKDGPVVTDGAWGTELVSRGLKPGASPELWNLENPLGVQEVPAAYIAAGSRIVLTNTFGGNRFIQKKFAQEGKIGEINRAGVEISKKAASASGTLVFASMGPSGKVLMMKDVTEAELQAAFEEQAQALTEAGADALVIETMAEMTEAIIAIKAARQTGLPVIGCMTFDSGKAKDRTMMGDRVSSVVKRFEDAGVDVIGSNCGQGIEGFVNICRQMREATALPLWIKANAGLPRFIDGETVFTSTPEEFASTVPVLIEAGANFIGGCCGTSPAFIEAVARVLKR